MKKITESKPSADYGLRKKTIGIMLLLFFCLSSLVAEPCGDVNSDGTINILDALMTAQYYVGLGPSPFDSSAADVSGDGAINIVDALQMAQYYVKLINVFAGCISTPTPPNTSQTYELQAETDATWDNAAVESDHSGYTGSGYVNTANASDVWIEWTLNVSAADGAVCEFRYAHASGDRPVSLSVNGSVVSTISFPASGAWTSWATQQASVVLSAGSNTIRLTATSSNGVSNMDKLDVTTGVTVVTPVPTPPPTVAPTPDPNATPDPQTSEVDGYAAYAGTTGGGNASPITVSSASAFQSAVNNDNAAVIIVDGRLNVGTIKIGSNKTIIGANSSSGLYGGDILIQGTNYIIKNLTFGPSGNDAMEIGGATKVFVTKCTFFNSSDELCSIVRAADYVTVSWSKFYFTSLGSHSFAHLISSSDSDTGDRGKLHVTMHHNWYAENIRGRIPRARFGHVHLYNNYIYSAGTGIGTGKECHIRLENTHFDNVGRPWSDYGSDSIMGWDNILFEGCSQPSYISNSYPAFDLPYTYHLDPVNDVESIVKAGAGNVF